MYQFYSKYHYIFSGLALTGVQYLFLIRSKLAACFHCLFVSCIYFLTVLAELFNLSSLASSLSLSLTVIAYSRF